MTQETIPLETLEKTIRNVPDFPKPGIQFKDITPVLSDPDCLKGAIEHMVGDWKRGEVDYVAGIDARGFIFGTGMALALNAGFVPVRKKGKLPYKTYEQSYELEYGSNTIEIHQDAVPSGARVLLVDDLLATGGTACAATQLLRKMGAEIVEVVFFIELGFLKGRDKFSGIPVRSLIQY